MENARHSFIAYCIIEVHMSISRLHACSLSHNRLAKTSSSGKPVSTNILHSRLQISAISVIIIGLDNFAVAMGKYWRGGGGGGWGWGWGGGGGGGRLH